jgi:carbohydrate-binding DOMON domain-containing protein
LKPEIPYTVGYEITRALTKLEGFDVTVTETSTAFQDKKDERKDNSPVVVKQTMVDNCVHLTVARFK